MAPTLVQSNKFDRVFTSSTTAPVTFSSALTSGSFLLAFASIGSNSTVTFADGTNTWTTVTSRYFASVGYTLAIGWAQNTSNSALTVTATFSVANTNGSIIAAEFSGVASSSPVDVFTAGANTTGTTTPSDVSMTTTVNGDLCVAVFGGDALPTGAGGGSTIIDINSSSQVGAEYQVQATAGSIAMSWTQGTTQQGLIVSAAFKAGSAPTPYPFELLTPTPRYI